MIDSLIDKQDNFEIIRDQIAAIIASESINQVLLATNASKPNPDDWKLRVFTERSNPWEQFLKTNVSDTSPLVNVWYDNSNFDKSASNIMERQKASGTFNIDVYGYGISSDNPAGGHNAGDELAALEVQKALRLVRNIIMAAPYTYLALRGLVWQRWPQSVNIFQPAQDSQTVQHVVGARIALSVEFNEFSPQITPETLEGIFVDVLRKEDGEIYFEADYDFT